MKFLAVLAATAAALNNGLGLTPAMGMNTWNSLRCEGITADAIKLFADETVKKGLDKYYKYVNIDDCWHEKERDPATQKLVPNKAAFPDGMKAVADYVHGKGLKLGIYTDRGTTTCAGYPGSAGFEELDAKTFAEWGIDYLKEDSCHASTDHETAFAEYGSMRDALLNSGRPILFSLCGWSSWYGPVGQSLGNSWRMSGDINTWADFTKAIGVLDDNKMHQFASAGAFNDPDMLVGSNDQDAIHLTPDQSRSQFSTWAIVASPLLIGSKVAIMNDFDIETYTNADVIAINQDPLAKAGFKVQGNVTTQSVWARSLANGDCAVLLLNAADTAADMTCNADCLRQACPDAHTLSFSVYDTWAHAKVGAKSNLVVAALGAGASVLYRLTPIPMYGQEEASVVV